MNIGFFVCIVSSLLFCLFALIFTFLKGKSAMLISGFNTLSKEQRASYDKEKMCKDQRNTFLLWSVILGTGAILSYFISEYAAPAAFAVWLVVFFKDVHLDEEKAFGKYKRKNK